MTNTISFRQAELADISFLLSLRKQTMHEHLLKADIFMDDEHHMMRVMECFDDSHIILLSGKPIGLLKLGQLTDRVHIRQFQILPQYQSKGLGGQILQRLLTSAAKQNKQVTLFVLKNNPAQYLYKKHGFTVKEQDDSQYFMSTAINQYKLS